MKRKIEFGCLLILTITWFVCMSAWLLAQGRLPIPSKTQCVPDTLISGTYSVGYRTDLRIPVTADWILCAGDIGKTKREPSWRFAEDTRVPSPRASHNDYTRSGYDRGHMVPAADRSQNISSMKSTFIMTNVCPQVPSLNRGAWKRLEESCRQWATKVAPIRIHVDAVFWVADTLRIGANHVAVPHGFVKSVYSWPTDTLMYSRYFQNW